MRVLFLNNEGAGFADYVEVEPGTTVNQFFSRQLPGRKTAVARLELPRRDRHRRRAG